LERTTGRAPQVGPLRARAGLVQENLNGRPSSSDEYRLILNYEVRFKGGKRR
jgi:hypothetical protein